MNKYYCKLTDKYYSDATIKSNLSAAYKEHYMFEPKGSCEGCGVASGICSAHIIPKSILKSLHLTSLIWSPEMFFRSCYKCNSVCENVSSDAITKLLNYERIKEVIKKYDPERASKLPR